MQKPYSFITFSLAAFIAYRQTNGQTHAVIHGHIERQANRHTGMHTDTKNKQTSNYTFTHRLDTVSEKNIPNTIDYHMKKGNPFLIIVGTNISGTTGHQMIVQYSTSPNVCFRTT